MNDPLHVAVSPPFSYEQRETLAYRKPSILRASVALAAVAWATACGDGATGPQPAANRSPVTVGTIPAQEVNVGQPVTVNVSAYFSDPDGDALSYTPASSDAGVATASVSGSTVTVAGVTAGAVTVTVTARDPRGLSAQQSFAVTVPNRSPETVDSIPDLELTVGDISTVDVSAYFSDPDGDALSYTPASSDAGVATASVSGSTVTVTGVTAGRVTVTVTARDPGGLSAQQSFAVTAEWPRPEASLSATVPTSPEGGVAVVEVILTPPEVAGTPPRELPIRVSYTLGVDGDLRTADADAMDYASDASSVVEIGPEANSAVLEITIHDDDEIEPVREVFTVTLKVPTAEAGYRLGSMTSVVLTIEEGVCDRTPQVRDEIVQQAGVGECTEVEDRHLAPIQELDLCFPKHESLDCEREDDLINALREGDFLGLSRLAELVLSGNDLTALPAGVFSGLSNLGRLELGRNQLTELPAGIFAGLSNLRLLFCTGTTNLRSCLRASSPASRS